MSEGSTDNDKSVALGINDDPPELFALVDLTTLEGVTFIKRAPLENVLLWGIILGTEGRQIKRLDLIDDLEQLQYLFWNTAQIAPADDLQTLKKQLAELANNLPEDTTSVEELRSRVPSELLDSSGHLKENSIMGQGSNTAGAIEKTGGKKKGSKKAAATKETAGTDGQAAAAETKTKKEKDPTGRPGEGTSTRKVWDIADSLVLQSGANTTPTRKAVIDAAVAAGVNKATAGVQYGAWMKGMNRAPAPEPVKPAAPAEGQQAAAPAGGEATTQA